MSKAEDLAKQLYPDPRMEDYDDILVYRADRDNASMGRINVVRAYEQAEKDLALTWKDIKIIVKILADSDWYDFEINGKLWSKEFYEEVLKRFKEAKK